MHLRRWVSRVRTIRRRRPRAYIPLALRAPQFGLPRTDLNRAGHALLAPDVEDRSMEQERASVESVAEED